MGVNWSLEIISFFAPHSMWQLSDVANALNGFFIFAIFILKKKVKECGFCKTWRISTRKSDNENSKALPS